MKNKEGDGIICDLCGNVFRKKFVYFSMVSTKVSVDTEMSKTGIVNVDDDVLDFEICENCYRNKLTSIIIKVRNDE